MTPWIQAARPKTLPLAISGILLGSALAYLNDSFKLPVLIYGITTALLLQVLSNFANDYGDFVKGTDVLAKRNDRMLNAGKISKSQMQLALWITAVICFASGIRLLNAAGLGFGSHFWLWVGIGIVAIAAALAYTIGKRAFGYSGYGDLVVLVFFGLAAVGGIFYLQAGVFLTEAILASLGCGLLSVAVLNVNNLRDIDSDKQNNKKTLPVRMGSAAALMYHKLLVWLGAMCILLSFLYHIQQKISAVSPIEFALIAGVFSPVFILIAGHMSRLTAAVDTYSSENAGTDMGRLPFNKELKTLSLIVLLATAIYWLLVLLYK